MIQKRTIWVKVRSFINVKDGVDARMLWPSGCAGTSRMEYKLGTISIDKGGKGEKPIYRFKFNDNLRSPMLITSPRQIEIKKEI